MAISVQNLYLKVEDTLAKNQAGNFGNDEFNLIVNMAQDDLMDFFLSMDGSSQQVHDALQPFIKKYQIAIANTVALPADYRSKRNARVRLNLEVNGTATFPWFPCDFLQTDEDFDTLASPIRGPSIANEQFLYKIDSGGISIFPENLTGLFEMSYIRNPLAASRAVTIDVPTETEVYNAGATVNLEWNSQQFNMFHDIICFYMSVVIRESEVIAWLQNRGLKR